MSNGAKIPPNVVRSACYHAPVLARVSASLLLAVALLITSSATVRADLPTPTPQVIDGEFVIIQSVTYGEGGIITALLFIAGLMMLFMLMHLAERFADR